MPISSGCVVQWEHGRPWPRASSPPFCVAMSPEPDLKLRRFWIPGHVSCQWHCLCPGVTLLGVRGGPLREHFDTSWFL